MRVRQWIWANRWPFFTCVFMIGVAIGYTIPIG